MECFRLLFDHLAWIEHQFLSGIRDPRKPRESVRDDERCGRCKEVNTQELIGQRVRVNMLGLLCWGFKGVQQEILSEEASTLQIGSVAFPPGQCTSQQLHPCHRLFDQDWHQDSSSPPHYSPYLAPCEFWLFPKLRGCRYETIEEMKEALTKVIDTLTRGLPWGLPEVVGTVQQVHCSCQTLLWRGVEFHVCNINKSAHTKKSLETYLMILVYTSLYMSWPTLLFVIGYQFHWFGLVGFGMVVWPLNPWRSFNTKSFIYIYISVYDF